VLTKDGIAKLADLGMARENTDIDLINKEKGMIIGTPNYIAPDQVRGQTDIDTRADIYSLGATLYHMVTGQPPFTGATVMEVVKAHETQELTPPDHLNVNLSAGIGEVVEMMMAKDRDERYHTAGELIIDLECLLNEEPPRLARQKVSQSLSQLSEGETDEEAEPLEVMPNWVMPTLVGMGVGLFLSLLLNLILMLKGRG
jgi:serine/threonine protein kinase